MGTVLYVTAEVIRQVAILVQPFMPASAAKLLDLLGGSARTSAISRRWAADIGSTVRPATLPRACAGLSRAMSSRKQRAS